MVDESPDSGSPVYSFDSNEERDKQIWQWAHQGVIEKEIAERVHLSVARIKQIKGKIRGQVSMMSRAELRKSLADQLDWARDRMAEIAAMSGAPVVKSVSRGDNAGSELVYVTDPETHEVARDYSGTIQATRALAVVQDRLAKLLGVDEPVRVEQSGTVRFEVAGIDPEAMR
jgi:DNA-binding CsgD family transcriptional regulator